MQLTTREAALLDALRRLPVGAADQLSELVERLAALPARTTVDWSDAWSEADLQEFTAASLRRLDAEEADEHH